jgi:hypothetical protein
MRASPLPFGKLLFSLTSFGRSATSDTFVPLYEMHIIEKHIAIATINRVDVLVSWNFRHIVNLQRIRGYNSVTLKWGYPLLVRYAWNVVQKSEPHYER